MSSVVVGIGVVLLVLAVTRIMAARRDRGVNEYEPLHRARRAGM